MRLTLAFWAIALTLLSEAFAKKLVVPLYLHNDILCYTGTTASLNQLTFTDAASAKTKTKRAKDASAVAKTACKSKFYTNSLALSLSKYCPNYVEYGWSAFTTTCAASNVTVKDIDVVIGAVDTSKVTEANVFGSSTKINGTVILDQHSFDMGYKTMHHVFGWSIYILVALALFIGLFRRIYSSYLTHLIVSAGATHHSEVAPSNSFWSRTNDKYMRWLGMPSLFSKRHVSSYGWFSLPTRLEGLCIFIYCAVNIIYDMAAYNLFKENFNFLNDTGHALGRYIADRTGVGCIYHIPLLWILAGRNDFLLWITGWSFASMNIFHRWVARICTFQAIAHSIAWTYVDWYKLSDMFPRMYWRAGVAAAVTMSLLAFPLSIKPLRDRYYEVFLIAHIVFALTTLVLCFFHLTKFSGQYDSFLWVCVGVWCFDRFVRYVRIGVLSYKAAAGDNSELISTGGANGLIRLTVTSSTRFTPKPGQHFYLYTPKSIKPWENHPFTLASWEAGPKGETRLHFLIGTKAGATRRLRKQVEAAQAGKAASCRVLVEGPYGHSCPVQRYDQALFIAGGSGITASLPYLHDLAERAATGKTVTKRATLVWVIKNNEYAEDVLAHELARMQGVEGFEFSLHIYITASSGLSTPLIQEAKAQHIPFSDDTAPGSSTGSSRNSTDSPDSSSVDNNEKRRPSFSEGIHTGRPEMSKVLADSLRKLVGSETLAVMACGPGEMMDDMRKAVCASYGTGEGQVASSRLEYFEESFSW
ncbi:hypothetical protein IAT38_002417 [Cryptococcus sp. DSM 104549]